MDKARKKFPVLRQYIYANTAGFGLLSEDLLEWRQEHDLDFLLKASAMRSISVSIIKDTRQAVSTMFHCKPANVALVSNFSLGINMLLNSFKKGTKILVLEDDYPSVRWPLDTREFTVVSIPITSTLEADIKKTIAAENIEVLALSLVQWVNGVKINLDFLKELKQTNPEVFVIADGTQFCGTTNFNFESSGIDVLGASAYKWMLSGYGNGFLLFKDSVQEKLNVPITGFYAADADEENKEKIPFAKKFEPGHLSCLVFGSLKFSIEAMQQWGVDAIEKQLITLASNAKEEFTKLGLLEDMVVARKEHSSIFNIKGGNALYDHLTQNGVVCSQRANGIRISFHFYNTLKDVKAIVEILKSFS